MLGAIVGDIVGSAYEGAAAGCRFALFGRDCAFTDDTVLTCAVAECLLTDADLTSLLKDYYSLYPDAGFSREFRAWARSEDRSPYYALTNGSAMRVSPVGWAFDTMDEVLAAAEASAAVTHNHPQGIAGAQATAAAIFMARNGAPRERIRGFIRSRFGYALNRSVAEIRPGFRFDTTCLGTVPVALTCALEAVDFEDALRLAVSLGGDADTLACIAGAVAQARFGGVPEALAESAFGYLPEHLASVAHEFCHEYNCY